MAVTITRTAMTDDDGSGTTGTVWNNAYKTSLYDQIDTALALLLPLAGGTLVGDLKFTDATYDIGKTGATRPRDLFTSRDVTVGRTLTVTGGQDKTHTLTGLILLNASSAAAAQGYQIDTAGLANGSNAMLVSAPTGWTGNFWSATLNLVTKFSVSQTGAVTAAGLISGTLGATITGAGIVAGAPTGGDKGAGTANFAADIYKNNTAYTNPDYVLEHWATGRIERFKDHDGAARYDGLRPLPDVERFTRRAWVLPRIAEARNAAGEAGLGAFGGGDAVLASLEEAMLYLFQHEARLTALEARPGSPS